MAQNYDLTQTGQELQERVDQVFPNRDDISALEEAKADRTELSEEIARAQGVEWDLQSQISGNLAAQAAVNESVAAEIANRYTKSETYNKTELDNMITTPDVQYVSVTATAQTTSVTDVLPATGAANTVYRVGSWEGHQYDANSYAEYSWNGTAYVLMDVKNVGIATGAEFDNPTAAQRALLTNVGAVLDGCDAVPTACSVKPVQSGGVYKNLSELLKNVEGIELTEYISKSGYITENGVYSTSYGHHGIIRTQPGDMFIIENYGQLDNVRYGLVNGTVYTNNQLLPYVEGTSVNVVKGNSYSIVIVPDDCYNIAFNCPPEYPAKIYAIKKHDDYFIECFSRTQDIHIEKQIVPIDGLRIDVRTKKWKVFGSSKVGICLIPVNSGEVYSITFYENANFRGYGSRVFYLKDMPDINNVKEGDEANFSDIRPSENINSLTGYCIVPKDCHCLYLLQSLSKDTDYVTSISKCFLKSNNTVIAGDVGTVENNTVFNDAANIAILTNKNIPFTLRTFTGISKNYIEYGPSTTVILVELPTENLKRINVINDNYHITYALIYQDIIPTSNFYVALKNTSVKLVEVNSIIQSSTFNFKPNRIVIVVKNIDGSDLSDITSIDDIIELEGITETGSYQQKLSVKKITMQMGFLSAITGLYPRDIAWYNGYAHSTMLIKNRGAVTIKTVGLTGKIYCYGSSQVYLGQNSRIDFDTTEGEAIINLPSNAEYYRVAVNGNIESIDIESYWEGDDEEYQKRPSNGYQPLTFSVKTVACGVDSDVSDIKEQYWLSTDSGMLHLPEKYTENGEPTPLIIFVHGAAGNFKPNSTDFTAGNPYAPEWDAMGYAQLDVDLIPDKYNSYANNQYGGSSDDTECIIGAYKWVIEHFNIRRDGVYLIGRSRGGQAVLQTLGKYNPTVLPIICAISNAGAHSLINYGLTNSSSSAEWNLICASYGLPSDGRPTPSGNSVLTAQDELYSFLLENISIWWKKACVAALLMTENESEYKTPSAILEFIHTHPRISGDDNVDYLNFLKTLRFKSPVPLRFDWCVADTTQPWKDNGGLGNYSSIVKDGFVNNLSGNAEYREWPTVDTTKEIISGATDRGHWHELYNIYDGDYTMPNGVVVTNPSMARMEWLMWCRRHDSRFSM